MKNDTATTNSVIIALIQSLSPAVVQLIAQHHGDEAATAASNAYGQAEQFLKGAGNAEGVDFHEGHAEINGQRVTVEFLSPSYATAEAKDSAFLARLAQQCDIGHRITKTIAGL